MDSGNPADRLIVADTITKLGPEAKGRVIVAASHGGAYVGYLAAEAGLAGAILNDAGVGRERAGIGGLDYLDRLDIPAAAVSHLTARIGSGGDMMARGVLSHVNRAAAALGLKPGQSCGEAAAILCARAVEKTVSAPSLGEARHLVDGPWPDEVQVWCLDSNALVEPRDKGQIIITGSHGGLLGGKPETAVRVDVFAALYNDAGGGIDEAGFSRLPALDVRAIAGATVAADTARIGDARSTYEDGIVTRVNATAARYGAAVGMTARQVVALFAEAKHRSTA